MAQLAQLWDHSETKHNFVAVLLALFLQCEDLQEVLAAFGLKSERQVKQAPVALLEHGLVVCARSAGGSELGVGVSPYSLGLVPARHSTLFDRR